VSVGILLIAHNNGIVQYGKLASLNAALSRRHFKGVEVALITDENTEYDCLDFHHVIKVDPPENSERHYIHDRKESTPGIFRNGSRVAIYDLTPFDETLVVDLDYLLYNSRTLEGLSESPFDVMINTEVRSIVGPGNPVIKMLSPESIPQQWATMVYFRKSPIAKKYFELVNLVRDNYSWYAQLYGFSKHLYRNDFAFTIASHVMNCYSQNELLVGSLPDPKLLFAWDHDILMDYHADGLIFAADHEGKYLPVRTSHQNVHVMNKISLMTHLEGMVDQQHEEIYIESYDER